MFFAPSARLTAWRTSFREAAAWMEGSFALWPSAEYRYASDWVLFTTSAAMPIVLPMDSNGGALGRGLVEVMVSGDVTGAVRFVDTVDVGVSLLAWALPSGLETSRDIGQTALTLFVRTDDQLDFPVGGGLEMIFNLDDEWGPTGGDGRYWGAHIFLTARIDG